MSDVPQKQESELSNVTHWTAEFKEVDPWPVICPACGGEGSRVVNLNSEPNPANKVLTAIIGFDWKRYNSTFQYGGGPAAYRFFCARCDGKGTVVE